MSRRAVLSATRQSEETDAGSAAPPPAWLVSLDAFRGVTIAAMLLVNNPGSWSHVYAPLLHAIWNGSTPAGMRLSRVPAKHGESGTPD